MKGSGDQCCQLQLGTSKIVVMFEFKCRFDIFHDFDIFGFFCEIYSINFDLFFTSHSDPTESDLFVKLMCFHKDH